MGFIQNNKFKEITAASKNGNEKAMKIIQALRNNSNQSDIDALINDYYSFETPNEEKVEILEEVLPENLVQEQIEVPNLENVEDLTQTLDSEFMDLLDENEIEETTFNNFLENKHRDGIRARKNSDYFKAYSSDDRKNYMVSKIDQYKKKFNGRLKNIERNYKDIDNSINKYIDNTNLELDDEIELDMDKVNSAYSSAINNENFMNSFGRSWDEDDNQEIYGILNALVKTYGKRNVLAVLNTLKNDNNNYRDYRNNQIDTEIGRYSKSIENLLK